MFQSISFFFCPSPFLLSLSFLPPPLHSFSPSLTSICLPYLPHFSPLPPSLPPFSPLSLSILSLSSSLFLLFQGSKFLDANQSQPNKLLPLEEVVLVSTVKGSNIFMLDPERAEVLKRINISPASLILGKLSIFKAISTRHKAIDILGTCTSGW